MDVQRAAALVARALFQTDAQLAELLSAEVACLDADTPENRAVVRKLLAQAEPRMSRARGQFAIVGSLFENNLTLVLDEEGAEAFVYDDDIVSLDDRDAPPGDPWARNVAAARAVRELFTSWRAQLVRSVRLCLFGGTRDMAQLLSELGAASRVSHLALRTQREGEPHVAIATAFPELRGLSCRVKELAQLLAEGAPALRSLVVCGDAWDPHVMEMAMHVPRLSHLGLFYTPTQPADLARLGEHPLMNRITSLEIFSTNDARGFPFDALLEKRDAFRYLRRIYLAGHIVMPDTRARFADWPEVEFVTWDRRETMAHDFWTTGWGADAR